MSLADVRPFYRTRFKGLGFKEHTDAFNVDNIPSTLLDKSFHIESDDIRVGPASQRTHNIDYPVTIRIFRKGFKDPGALNDELDVSADTILEDLLSPSVKHTQTIRDVVVTNIRRIPLDDSNDNAIILEITCNTRIICAYA